MALTMAQRRGRRERHTGRAYLYMAHTYGGRALPLRLDQRAQFERWHRNDPPDDWEFARDARIAKIQGANNPFVRGAASARGLEPAP